MQRRGFVGRGGRVVGGGGANSGRVCVCGGGGGGGCTFRPTAQQSSCEVIIKQ